MRVKKEGRPAGALDAVQMCKLNLLETDPRQNLGAFYLYRLQAARIEPQCFKNGGCNLCGLHRCPYGSYLESGIGQQQHYIRVVVAEAAVLHQFGCATRVNHTWVGRDDDVRGARVAGGQQPWPVECQSQRVPVEDLSDPGLSDISLKRCHGFRSLA